GWSGAAVWGPERVGRDRMVGDVAHRLEVFGLARGPRIPAAARVVRNKGASWAWMVMTFLAGLG
ncbi:MAG TPA: hypothetical protein VK784_12150, partial [Pseudonocardiaceae bacterium]|nr:hypothetical protein [Pseudonocardiaceae bacterium]